VRLECAFVIFRSGCSDRDKDVSKRTYFTAPTPQTRQRLKAKGLVAGAGLLALLLPAQLKVLRAANHLLRSVSAAAHSHRPASACCTAHVSSGGGGGGHTTEHLRRRVIFLVTFAWPTSMVRTQHRPSCGRRASSDHRNHFACGRSGACLTHRTGGGRRTLSEQRGLARLVLRHLPGLVGLALFVPAVGLQLLRPVYLADEKDARAEADHAVVGEFVAAVPAPVQVKSNSNC
jgi:hypothetical protein